MASVHQNAVRQGRSAPIGTQNLKGRTALVWTLNDETPREETRSSSGGCMGKAAEVARNGRLTHEKAQKFLAECEDITRGDGFKKSQGFLDECLRQSTGSGLNTPYPGKVFSRLAGGQGTARPDQREHADAICAHPGTVRRLSAGHPAAIPFGQHHGERH